jgi:3-oxoacyl-[acyl-carrier-protein] synthase II
MRPVAEPDLNRRVVVTGMAGLTPLGLDWKHVGDAIAAGRSGVEYVAELDAIDGLNTRLGARAHEFEVPKHYPRKKLRAMGRVSLLATRATELALEDSGLLGDPVVTSGRTGISYGSNSGSPAALSVYAEKLFAGKTLRGIAASDYLKFMSHTCAANLAAFFEVRGRIIPTSSACASGSQGIGYAYEAIRFGQQDVMLAGGADEFGEIDVAVFDVLYAASTRNDTPQETPRPFDRDRDGLVVAEGAGCLVLEDLDRARSRGARIHAEILGYATCCDGRHLTNPDPAGMERVMRLGLENAALGPDAIDYVNAHATGTEAGDIAESAATFAVFGGDTPVSTLKGHLGHTLGACGVLDAWITIEMLRDGWLAPTLHLENVDDRCAPLDYVMEKPRPCRASVAVSHNFGFGGVNTSLVLKTWSE